jgi:thioredoxin-dependent peroxiredoxin
MFTEGGWMKRLLRVLPVVMATCGAFAFASGSAAADDLKAGDKAPDFTLSGTDGKTYSLSQLKGKTVVLAWFPKAFTGG